MRLRSGARHPLALGLLAACCLIAAALLWVPALGPWSSRAGWVLLVGLAAYLAAAAVAGWPRARRSPALAELRRIRQRMADQLAELRAAGSSRTSPLAPVLAEALGRLDRELLPALADLTDRHEALGERIARYDSRQLPSPDPAIMARLRVIHGRQRAAIATCVRQAANAEAALVALTQEADDARLVEEARRWADELLDVHDALAEVLRGEEA